jgi:hypothetical protein
MSRLVAVVISFVITETIVATAMQASCQGLVESAHILVSNLATIDVQNEKAELLIFVTPKIIREPSTENDGLLEPTEMWLYTSPTGDTSCVQFVKFSFPGQIAAITVEVADDGRSIVIGDEAPVSLAECVVDAQTKRLIVGAGKRVPPYKVDEIIKNPTAAGLPSTTITITDLDGGTKAVVQQGKPLLIIAEDVEGEAL